MNILTLSSPIYSRSDHSLIDCIVTFDDPKLPGEHLFTAAAHDTSAWGQALWEGLNSGSYLNWAGTIAPYVTPTLTAAQKVASAISSGIVITSSENPALNATYPIDANAQNKLNGVITYLMLNGAFPPSSASTLAWYDIGGNAHTFNSIAEFKAFATAFTDFVTHLVIYADSDGQVGSIPSNEITIP